MENDQFTAEYLMAQAREGRMEAFIHEFLCSSGNNSALSEGLKRQKRYWIGPVEMELDRLDRCGGPEESMEYQEQQEHFETHISRMIEAIRNGWEVPPLIIECRGDRLSIRDGNHRLVALQRAGIERTRIIVWFNSLDELLQKARFEPAVFFITGTSGAGKTTLMEGLKSLNLTMLDIHDFDEGGVPEGADQRWRMERTEEWLQKAVRNRLQGMSTVICGVSVPQEIRSSPSFNGDLRVRYGLLRAEESEIRRRLAARNWSQGLIDDNIEWAKHLERFVRAENERYIPWKTTPTPEETVNGFLDWIIRETASL